VYLVQRHQTWWAFHDVPPSVREKMGRSRLHANLKTHDRGRARVLAAVHEARWRAAIERASRGVDAVDQDADPDPARYRRALKSARTATEREAIMARVADEADELGMTYADPKAPRDLVGEFYAAATAVGFGDYLDAYAKTLTGQLTAKTIHMRLANLRTFAGVLATVADIQRPAVQQWVYAKAADGAGRATIARAVTDLRLCWKYLVGVGAASETPDPFKGITLAGAKPEKLAPFEPAQIVQLEAEARARGDGILADFILLAMYTGARREELATLRCGHIDLARGAIAMPGTKSDAARREVPIHPALRPVLQRLVNAAGGKLLFPKPRHTKFGKLGDALGKRFHTLKEGIARNDQDFHSIRRTVCTMAEDVGIQENILARVVGHKIPRLSLGLYSAGPSLATKAAEWAKLAYPKI
jgi:integrase